MIEFLIAVYIFTFIGAAFYAIRAQMRGSGELLLAWSLLATYALFSGLNLALGDSAVIFAALVWFVTVPFPLIVLCSGAIVALLMAGSFMMNREVNYVMSCLFLGVGLMIVALLNISRL